ncbi:hypothetical protein RU94_GL002347 [Enterococcus asini]|nr:hypothetical protein RU94_GL002347 [Enterococcus asini]
MQAFYFYCVCFSKKFDTVTYLTKNPYIKDFFLRSAQIFSSLFFIFEFPPRFSEK